MEFSLRLNYDICTENIIQNTHTVFILLEARHLIEAHPHF